MNEVLIPRCEHGQIVLGCARDDCRIQNEYLAAQEASLQAWRDRIQRDAEQVVREALGLPTA